MTTENKFVDVNGAQVMDLTNKPIHCRPLALVDLDVLVKITYHLGKGSMRTIQRGLLSEIRDVDPYKSDSLEALVHICDEFVAFHNTVNLIQKIEHPLNAKPSEKVSKANLDDIGDEC